jgi:hypothetical protein
METKQKAKNQINKYHLRYSFLIFDKKNFISYIQKVFRVKINQFKEILLLKKSFYLQRINNKVKKAIIFHKKLMFILFPSWQSNIKLILKELSIKNKKILKLTNKKKFKVQRYNYL